MVAAWLSSISVRDSTSVIIFANETETFNILGAVLPQFNHALRKTANTRLEITSSPVG